MSTARLAEKIGEGHLRECFAIKGKPGLCVKRLKPGLSLLQRLHLRLLRRGMHRLEYKTYRRLPPKMKPYFNPVISVAPDHLVAARPLDFDGSHSRPVSHHRQIANKAFWKEVDNLISLFEKYNIWFFDAFQLGENVFVQKLSPTHWRPVIVDYKRQGWRSYPAQLNLLLDSEKKKKFYRKYRRFVNRYKGRPAV